MTRYLKIGLALLWIVVPGVVHALGVGGLEVNSKLNEPLEARLELTTATVPELDTLTVRLASNEELSRVGLSRHFHGSPLYFEVVRPDQGRDYVRVYSTAPIREPFLQLLLQFSWNGGRLLREFTLLLDPPQPSAAVSKTSSTVAPPAARARADEGATNVGTDAVPPPPQPPNQPAPAEDGTSAAAGFGTQYGPVSEAETLWSIAQRYRPSPRVRTEQFMLGVLRANPEAFIQNNINLMRRGIVLRIPSEQEFLALDVASSKAEVQRQDVLWRQLSPAAPSMPRAQAQVGDASVSQQPEAARAVAGELQVVASGVAGGAADSVSIQAERDRAKRLEQELLLAQETMETLRQQDVQNRTALQDMEALNADQRRLLALKDKELALLQQRLAEALVENEQPPGLADGQDVISESPPPSLQPQDVVAPEDAAVAAPIDDATAMDASDAVAVAESEETERSEDAAAAGEGSGEEGIFEDLRLAMMSVVAQAKRWLIDNLYIRYGLLGLFALLLVFRLFVWIHERRTTNLYQQEAEARDDDLTNMEDGMEDSDLALEEDIFEDDSVLDEIEGEDIEDMDAVEATRIGDGMGSADFDAVDSAAEEAEKDSEVADDLDLDLSLEQTGSHLSGGQDDTAEGEHAEAADQAMVAIDTYLAFEQYEQAEESVLAAIQTDPKNLDYHIKLLEVFYTAGDRKSYEEGAKTVHDLVTGEGKVWDQVLAMWSEMSNRPLFSGGGDVEGNDESSTAGSRGVLDLMEDESLLEDESSEDADAEKSGTGAALDDDFEFEGSAEASLLQEGAADGSAEALLAGEEEGVLDLSSPGQSDAGQDSEAATMEAMDELIGDIDLDGESETDGSGDGFSLDDLPDTDENADPVQAQSDAPDTLDEDKQAGEQQDEGLVFEPGLMEEIVQESAAGTVDDEAEVDLAGTIALQSDDMPETLVMEEDSSPLLSETVSEEGESAAVSDVQDEEVLDINQDPLDESTPPLQQAGQDAAISEDAGALAKSLDSTFVTGMVMEDEPLDLEMELEEAVDDGPIDDSLSLQPDEDITEDITTKLDLARAVIELGEHDNAREVLDGILNDERCTPAQREEAQALRSEL